MNQQAVKEERTARRERHLDLVGPVNVGAIGESLFLASGDPAPILQPPLVAARNNPETTVRRRRLGERDANRNQGRRIYGPVGGVLCSLCAEP